MPREKDEEIEQAQEIASIKSEVHSLKEAFNTFIEEFKSHRDRTTPNPITLTSMIGIFGTILGILVVFMSAIMYLIHSSNSPIIAQQNQILQIMQQTQNSVNGNRNDIQLTNKDLSNIKTTTHSNEDTLHWMLFDENLPKQITILQEQFKHHTHK